MRAAALVLCVLLLAMLVPVSAASVAEDNSSILAEGDFSIVGLVSDVNGNGLASVNITAVNATDGSYVISTFTNSGGGYTLVLAAGTYNISATLKDHRANTIFHEISEGDDGLSFTMYEVLGTVTGYIDDGLYPVHGARVVLSNGTLSFTAVTSVPRGEYKIENVTPGIYLAHVEKEGYNDTFFYPIEVRRGEITHVNITMVEQPSWLSGKVTYGGAPLEGVQVTLESKNGVKYTNMTDDEGGYYFKVPSGEYTITFSKSGFLTSEVKKILLPLRENTEDVVLKKSALPGNTGFLPGHDLPHSMMIVGLFLALVMLVVALFIRFRVAARPELLAKTNDEDK